VEDTLGAGVEWNQLIKAHYFFIKYFLFTMHEAIYTKVYEKIVTLVTLDDIPKLS